MQIFVLGTGRSGTHWLGYILDAHPDIHVAIEERTKFRLATRAALRPGRVRSSSRSCGSSTRSSHAGQPLDTSRTRVTP